MRRSRTALARIRGPLIYAALCLVVLLAFADRAWEHVATLNGEEWEPVQSFIRAHRTREEPICFLPTWTVGHATDQYKFRGIDVIENPEDAWSGPEEQKQGFWVVSQFGEFDESRVPQDRYPHRRHFKLGGADVFVFRSKAISIDQPLSLRIHEAKCVLNLTARRHLDLVWKRTGFTIPRNYPNRNKVKYIGCRAANGRFAGRAHTGIWFHPPLKGQFLTLTWPEIEFEEPWLEVGGGLRDSIAKRKAPPIHLEVSLDGEVLRKLSFPAKRGWRTHAVSLETAKQAGREKGRLAFKVWTSNNHSRHFIINGSFKKNRPTERGIRDKSTMKTQRQRQGKVGASGPENKMIKGTGGEGQTTRDRESSSHPPAEATTESPTKSEAGAGSKEG